MWRETVSKLNEAAGMFLLGFVEVVGRHPAMLVGTVAVLGLLVAMLWIELMRDARGGAAAAARAIQLRK